MTAMPKPMAPAAGVSDLRDFLIGTWRLTRSIEDRRGVQTGSLRGRAIFAPERIGLHYREEGRLRLGAHAGVARQAHLYRFPCAHRAEVRFEDARPFHDLDLSAGTWEVVHFCGADTYRGRFQVVGLDLLTVHWTATGPRKDYVIFSRYRRAPGQA